LVKAKSHTETAVSDSDNLEEHLMPGDACPRGGSDEELTSFH